MKKLAVLALLLALGCSTSKTTFVREDTMVVTRKYVGDFMDYRTAEFSFFTGQVLWIKTSMDSTYGKIGIYAKGSGAMKFIKGERLYVRRINYQHPGFTNRVFLLESSNEKYTYNIYGTNKDPNRRAAIDQLFSTPKFDEEEEE